MSALFVTKYKGGGLTNMGGLLWPREYLVWYFRFRIRVEGGTDENLFDAGARRIHPLKKWLSGTPVTKRQPVPG